MLVLSRRQGEEIVVGPPDNPIARIVIVEIRGGKVSVGVDAEADVPVNRLEVLEEKRGAA